jgi:hypothetical protein
MVGVAILGSAAIGAGASIYAANTAADAQTAAANNAINAQMAQYNRMRNDLSPYMTAGSDALAQLQAQLPGLTAPITMDEATLQNTPGYQFNLAQGLRANQNALTATGLGRSGAAVKAADRFATGLADSTYQNQFNNAQTNRQTTYNMLSGLINTGQNAAAGVGSAGIQTGQGVAGNMIGAGNAQAGAATATGNAIGNAANSFSSYALLNSLLNRGAPSTGMYQTPTNSNPFWASQPTDV